MTTTNDTDRLNVADIFIKSHQRTWYNYYVLITIREYNYYQVTIFEQTVYEYSLLGIDY